jgi:hypothetical protein
MVDICCECPGISVKSFLQATNVNGSSAAMAHPVILVFFIKIFFSLCRRKYRFLTTIFKNDLAGKGDDRMKR